MEVGESFDALVQEATGHEPYGYQRRVAEVGLPEALRVPTGAGKTMAAVLGWLYRRRFHPDEEVRAETPRWLAFVLPVRVLVKQTVREVERWLDALAIPRDQVGVHELMGGEGRRSGEWRRWPERDAVFVGTLDMLLSRALNRGYGESRFAWPIDFGLFNAGVHWVIDEVQLMGPALQTSRQLQALREKLGTAMPCASTWMSATLDERTLVTVDNPEVRSVVELDAADATGPLLRRLEATKAVRAVHVGDRKRYAAEVAAALAAAHRPGTLTLAVLNTVDRARQVWEALGRQGTGADVVLLHSRFRPVDRDAHLRQAFETFVGEAGRIVVSTQVIEAGVDVSATTLLTEVAPWSSVVQRAGRCNRDGLAGDATLLWVEPPDAKPYEQPDVDRAAQVLAGLDGQPVTAPGLGAMRVTAGRKVRPLVRRRDVLQLFDTAPDLSGNDLDVSRFIRADEELDVQVAWWSLEGRQPAVDRRAPAPEELCPVPVGQAKDALRKRGWRAWRRDHVAGQWVRCTRDDLRPGLLVVLDAEDGGYQPRVGWDPSSTRAVAPVPGEGATALTDPAEDAGDDPLSQRQRRWVTLSEHLAEVEAATRELLAGLGPPGLREEHVEAAALAARLHDAGKAHETFQDTLERSAATDNERPHHARDGDPPWAKSGGSLRARHARERRGFRHELVSALLLLDDEVLDGVAEADLVRYLVAAHHGRVRVSIRSLPDERGPDGVRQVLGVRDGDVVAQVAVPGAVLPGGRLDLSVMELGEGVSGEPSWTERVLRLRDDPWLGPFRLGFLEAMVRLADWRVSAEGER